MQRRGGAMKGTNVRRNFAFTHTTKTKIKALISAPLILVFFWSLIILFMNNVYADFLGWRYESKFLLFKDLFPFSQTNKYLSLTISIVSLIACILIKRSDEKSREKYEKEKSEKPTP